MSREFLLSEKYRPQKISDCILPDRLKKVFQEYVNRKTIPNLMLTGTAGVGKTTAAIAMCEEIGLDYIFINSSEERGIDTLRTKIRGYASTVSFSGSQKVIILDEADYITPEAQAALRGAIEEFSSNCSFIFTCNYKNKIIEPLHSRCAVVDFTINGKQKPAIAASFFKRLGTILEAEGIKYDPKVLVEIINQHFPDWRRILNECQRYSAGGSIDTGILSILSNVNTKELVGYLFKKEFPNVRKWIVQNLDNDPNTILRNIYDCIYDALKPNSIPEAVLIIAKYQYQTAFVADQEINLLAALTEIMCNCEFK